MDLSAYNLLDTFTIHDVAYLLCEHEPLEPSAIIQPNDPHEIIRHKANNVANQLIQDADTGKLIAHKKDISSDEWRLAGAPQWIVTRQALQDWATAKGIKPVFLFPECISPKSCGSQRKHATEYLEIMEEAIQEFWENHEPTRPPKKELVVAWLTNKGISKRIAASMDTIMRTPEAKIGGNKPRTPKIE